MAPQTNTGRHGGAHERVRREIYLLQQPVLETLEVPKRRALVAQKYRLVQRGPEQQRRQRRNRTLRGGPQL